MNKKNIIPFIIIAVLLIGCRPPIPTNDPPEITSLSAGSSTVPAGTTVTITAQASDPEGDALTYSWTKDGGTLSDSNTNSVDWTAPDTEGTYVITVKVDDGFNSQVSQSITLSVGSPEINVTQGGTNYLHNDSTYAFPSQAIDSQSSEVRFLIANSGSGTLDLTGDPLVSVTGSHSSQFIVTQQPSQDTVVSNGNIFFYVAFAPTGVTGTRTATLQIENSDANESPYSIVLTGEATESGEGTTEPEINIKMDDTDYASGSSVDFGDVSVDTDQNLTFTIENNGDAPLTLSGSPLAVLGGSDSSHFTVTQPSSATVAASGTTTFSISFSPTTTGSKTATVQLTSNDADEGIYTINLTGNGTEAGGSVTAEGLDLSFGSTVVGTSDTVDITVTALDGSGEIATAFTGTVALSSSDTNVSLSPDSIAITAGGTATASVSVSYDGLSGDVANPEITASFTGLTSQGETITVYEGTVVSESEISAAGGFTTLAGLYVLPPRETTDVITVPGQISVGAGTTLLILEGNTLLITGNYPIDVQGKLDIRGTDEKRVKIIFDTINTESIVVNGGDLNMNGAYLMNDKESLLYLGGSTSSMPAGDVTITNSRFRLGGDNDVAIDIKYLSDYKTYEISHNIFEWTDHAPRNALLVRSSNDSSGITFNYTYNTIIARDDGSTFAINITDSDVLSTYNIERNLIASGATHGFNYMYGLVGTTTLNIKNNFAKYQWAPSGGSADPTVETENVYETTSTTGTGDNFGATWNAATVFENYTTGDFRLKLTSPFPTASQIGGLTVMEGCLTKGSDNEVGAYGNGGYPPLPTE